METLHASDFDSPIGRMRAVSSERGVAYLELPHANGRGFRGWLARHAPGARVEEGFAPNRACIAQVIEYLESKRVKFDLELDLRGTEFQLEVYAALAKIPYGESRSYTDLARQLGRPRAVRAVGAANGSNPLSLVIPCHRVIGRRGTLQGYAGGVELKARLLAMESRGSLV